jgi:hypothetical protein
MESFFESFKYVLLLIFEFRLSTTMGRYFSRLELLKKRNVGERRKKGVR